jgi:cellulose biosynthesis protein BcsQ
MLVQASMRRSASAHVVVLGNEKGGSGKSTTAMHIAAALMNVGQRVATIDLDSRQKTFTHYIAHRRSWAERAGIDLKIPTHFCIARGTTLKLDDNEASEFSGFADALSAVEQSHDFVVVDTPGTDSYLMRLAHSMADTLVTPLNDSFVDFDVLGTVDPISYAVTGESHYAAMVRDARRQRREIDGTRMDWVVVRNRLSLLGSRQQAAGGRRFTRAVGAARLSLRRWLRRTRHLSRVFPARAHRARSSRRDDARSPAESRPSDRPPGGHDPDRGPEASVGRARPATRSGACRVVFGAGQTARRPRHPRGLNGARR